MTKVFYREYYDHYLLIVEGHTKFNEKGKNIICAAISILIFTLLNIIKDEESANRLKIKKEIIYDGYFQIEIEPFEFSKNKIDGIIETIILGFCLLNEEYPEYVKLE